VTRLATDLGIGSSDATFPADSHGRERLRNRRLDERDGSRSWSVAVGADGISGTLDAVAVVRADANPCLAATASSVSDPLRSRRAWGDGCPTKSRVSPATKAMAINLCGFDSRSIESFSLAQTRGSRLERVCNVTACFLCQFFQFLVMGLESFGYDIANHSDCFGCSFLDPPIIV